jgi:hypothetical protein
VATHDSNNIIKFADDTTVVGLITDDDETVYREEVRDLEVWCQDNNLPLDVSKTKELRAEHAPIYRTVVETVESFKFLGVHITKDLSWRKHTNTVMKRAQQRLFPLMRLKRFSMGPQILKKFYSCNAKSILTGCINASNGNCLASDCKTLQRVVRKAQYITGAELPTIQAVSEEGLKNGQRLQPPKS